jgi:hypothetical protein
LFHSCILYTHNPLKVFFNFKNKLQNNLFEIGLFSKNIRLVDFLNKFSSKKIIEFFLLNFTWIYINIIIFFWKTILQPERSEISIFLAFYCEPDATIINIKILSYLSNGRFWKFTKRPLRRTKKRPLRQIRQYKCHR